MVAQYIEAIEWKTPAVYAPSIFLGGGITGCVDWQRHATEALANLAITIYNPRRKSFDITKLEESERQIDWEYHFLRECGQILFYFPHETLCPISLFELGGALERGQKIFVACHPEYKRKFDVEYQIRRMNEKRPKSQVVVHDHLDKALEEIIAWNT